MTSHIPSAANLHWNTPHFIKDGVYATFQGAPTLDPCSNSTSIMGAKTEYMLPSNDGLKDRWALLGPEFDRAFLNAPFGKCYMTPDRSSVLGAKEFQNASEEVQTAHSVHTSIADWVQRASDEFEYNGVETISIQPAAVDTKVFQDIVFKTATSILWIKGRVRFLMPDGTPGGPCPMAMALVLWGGESTARRFEQAFQHKGTITQLGSF